MEWQLARPTETVRTCEGLIDDMQAERLPYNKLLQEYEGIIKKELAGRNAAYRNLMKK